MGEIGGRLAGYCIITSDNPRTEDPAKILEDVEVGVKKTDCPYEKIVKPELIITPKNRMIYKK